MIRIAQDKYVIITWSVRDHGFGEYTFWKDGNKIMCDNECDSRQKVKDVMCMLVDKAEFTGK